MLIPHNDIQDLRDYVGFSQNLQRLIIRKSFSEIKELLDSIIVSIENKFFINEVLRQTFPHKKELSNWESVYLVSLYKLNIKEIKSFQSK